MTTISAKQFVRPLTDKCHFDVLAGSLTYEIHWNDRGSRDRLLQCGHNFWQRLFEDRPGDANGRVVGSQDASSLFTVCQFVISIARAISHRVRRPRTSVEIHQPKQQSGIDAAA